MGRQGTSPTHHLRDFFGPKAVFHGFNLVKSSGPNSCPIVDRAGKVCAVYGGAPDDPDFMATVHDPAVEAMEQARAKASLTPDRFFHRRGNFGQLSGGDSHGGRQVEPGALVNGVINTAIFLSLISNDPFIRLAGFVTGLFANWALKLFDLYVDYMGEFYSHHTNLRRPFVNSIWSACTFNLGPYMCALGHRDFANLVFGWCAITAFGLFDWKRGGHLILWDCKLILEFPPSCTHSHPQRCNLSF
ncbi:hypothetical protein MVEN_00107900 [Mycena venus]|uniref:Uncharacterized protein n=1 Tax=Mycena venus TaxID=2733690 RepID=A0A8H7DHJ2_9AGAR|nr:hypothetical protein MVEN_00107900 [Mycena venus]